jgi:hypothetical protein
MGRKDGDTDPYRPDAPGWYPDPWSATGGGERYFDGRQWGTSERPRGRHTTAAVATLKPPRARGVKALVARFRIPIILLLIAAVAVGLWVRQESQRNQSTEAAVDRSIGVTRPPPGTEVAQQRLSPAPVAAAGPGKYEFQRTQSGDPKAPVGFDPCRPIHWVYNPAGAPADGLATVKQGVATLADTTGLRFVYDGRTDETPTRDRVPYLPDRYDDKRWAPVLVGWSDENGFRDLVGHVTGATRPDMVTQPDGRSMYVSGVVVLDRDDLSEAAMPDRSVLHATVGHELGHLVGLDHTVDRSQLMFSETQPGVRDYGSGDLQGLALEGSQACFPDV